MIRYFKSVLLTIGMNTCQFFFFRRSLIKTKQNRIIMVTSVTNRFMCHFAAPIFKQVRKGLVREPMGNKTYVRFYLAKSRVEHDIFSHKEMLAGGWKNFKC